MEMYIGQHIPRLGISWVGVAIAGLLLAVILAVPIVCAAIVYSDAKKRGLSAGLWALFAFFTTIIGLIVYFLTRPAYAELCSQCGTPLRNGFVACPKCGAKSTSVCAACNRRLQPGWMVCPYCGKAVSAQGVVEVTEAGEEKTGGTRVVVTRPAPVKRTSGLAVASLVVTLLGPVGWFCIGFRVWAPFSVLFSLIAVPLAIILAIAARVSIRDNPETLGGRWMATTALVLNVLLILGLVIAGIVIGGAILVPEILDEIF